MTLPRLSRRQLTVAVTIVVGIALVGGLAWAFGQQLVLASQLRADETRMEQAVAVKQAHYDELTDLLAYVESDEYVERWAREDARMIKPGEVAVVPLVVTIESPPVGPGPTPEPAPEPKPIWTRVWEFIFGSDGP